jgi:hypothetical protein
VSREIRHLGAFALSRSAVFARLMPGCPRQQVLMQVGSKLVLPESTVDLASGDSLTDRLNRWRTRRDGTAARLRAES